MTDAKRPHVGPIVPDPLPDGTPLTDLQAAMEAAWMAGFKNISAELSKRYGLYNTLCLRCGIPSLSITALLNNTDCYPDSYFVRLCQPCQHEETPSVGKTLIIDGPGFNFEHRVDRKFDMKPILDRMKAALAKLPPIDIVMTKAPRGW